ncbi:MAG: protein kinase [Myxococcota bacterium]|nr:protein kinase [Myxococcota bacterium]
MDMDDKADPRIGATVGNLVLIAKLGTGGMGTVYRAEHRALKTHYAVKVLHPQFSQNPATVERFRREAVAASRLRHENVVFVTDFGVQEGLGIYIVMELLEGDSLKEVLRECGRIPIGRLGRIADQVCDAMAAAHRLDIVHRDLKPDNIVLLRDPNRRDFIKVLDFGIAHIKDAADDVVNESAVTVGTPAYIAPEQVVGKPEAIGPAADIYSLGIIFFELLTGTLPFARGASDMDLLTAHVTQPAPLLSERYPALAGTKVEALIASMMEKKPERRPTSMLEVRARLAEAIRELRERGDPDAFYGIDEGVPMVMPPPPSTPVPISEHSSSPSLHITSLVRKIKQDAPDSPAAALLSALPNADRMGGEAIALALWGMLQGELLDAPIESERFRQALKHFALLMEAVVFAHGGSQPTESQQKVFRALKNLMTLAPKDRQTLLLEALQNLLHHPIFPKDILPKDDKGGWQALRSVMGKEIKLFGDSKPAPARRPPAEPKAGGPPTDPAFRARYDRGMALYLEEKFEEAIKELKAAYFLRPYHPILFTLGSIYKALRQPAEALEHFEKYRQAEPNMRPETRAKLEGLIAEVQAMLRSEPEPRQEPTEPPDGELVLELELESRVPEPPRATHTPPPQSQPSSTPTQAQPPAPKTQRPAPEPAAPPAQGQPRRDPFDECFSRGAELAQAGRFEEAVQALQAAYRIRPDPNLLFHIAWCYRALGRPRDALQYFVFYQHRVPDLKPEAQQRLAALIAEAQAQLRTQTASSPPAAHTSPARPEPAPQPSAAAEPASAGSGDATGLPPGAVPPPTPTGTYAEHHGRAIRLHKAGQYEPAIREFLAAYQLNPVPALLFNIAATYRLLKRPHAALYYFDRFSEAEPDLAEPLQIKLSNLKAEARQQIEAERVRRAGPLNK